MTDVPWQKSSFSAEGANCVNVASGDGVVLFRESEEPGVVMRVEPERFWALVRRVKAGGV